MFLYRSVIPDMPDPEAYAPLLREMHGNRWYSNFGPLAVRFEDALAARYGAGGSEACVCVTSATAGLSAAIMAAGVTGNVLVPAFTFPASLGAVRAAGAIPVVCDVDPDTWTVSPDILAQALRSVSAQAVMIVEPFGIHQALDALIDLCLDRGLAVIIDSAAGLGVPREPRPVRHNVFTVFSMHATKPFAVGEGGCVFAHRDHAVGLRSAVNFALPSHPGDANVRWGFNGKMSELHAAVGLAQLERIDGIAGERQRQAAIYRDRLAGQEGLVTPDAIDRSPWQCFPVCLPSASAAEALVARAAAVGVEIRRYYRPSLSQWPDTAVAGACPAADSLAGRMCVLPLRSGASQDEAPELMRRTVAAVLETMDDIGGSHV